MTAPAVLAEPQAGPDGTAAWMRATPTGRPFDAETVEFAGALSRRLGRAGGRVPELQALAYWTRPGEIRRLAADFAALENDGCLLVPRGTVFHVPPSNVDTIFVYSWLMSALVGNRNVVRLSDRAGGHTELIVGLLRELLDEGFDGVRDALRIVRYGHDDTWTAALSAACDLRVIWGGDSTVDTIRRSPLPPHATELTFPDRFSLAVMRAPAYLAAPDRDALVSRFRADAYMFDQRACSSPRLVVWVGSRAEAALASEDFFGRLATLVGAGGYPVDGSLAVSKLGYVYGAVLDQPVSACRWYDNALAVLTVERFGQPRREHCGGGVFHELRLDALNDLVPHIERRDQTIVHHGFTGAELTGLVRALNGRGVDRIVPLGQALTFQRVWDGHDLLQAFTRRVTVSTAEVLPG
ncbi:hypothetical protein Val02_85730 [Virgisporangium aliadipatigenens]|uniref:Long-chain-fatty-acyl-CoA reductase n=1 Tax=Virgisporangium aliadipatigenens TaxID=741659 RepID=A0A8J4DX34_9ACTN|nr:acyl-CoA reductase [Virgisporangium aliadipatigenens]GIJ51687.1 hypothetical protein Val02_85730 [Virgisporangium aliadipatigenens]